MTMIVVLDMIIFFKTMYDWLVSLEQISYKNKQHKRDVEGVSKKCDYYYYSFV